MNTFMLSKPRGEDRIPASILAFVGRKLRNDIHQLVLDAFRQSGLSQADLARRIGADAGQVCRQIGSPGNWTIDTAAKLLFAISGEVVAVSRSDPDAPALANMTIPTWLTDDVTRKTESATSISGHYRQGDTSPYTSTSPHIRFENAH